MRPLASPSFNRAGLASPNEIEQKQAESAAKQADLESTEARLQRATLEGQ